MEASGILSIILLVAAILAVFIPFFILKIRNQVISINEKMDKIIELLGGESRKVDKVDGKPIWHCIRCGAKNRMEDSACINCGGPV